MTTKNNRWVPAIPRPTVEGEIFEQFLADWVKKEYAEEFKEDQEYEGEEFDITEFGIYQSILEHWGGDDENTAEELIKRDGWSYCDAKAFEEKGLYFDISKHEDSLAEDWIKENGYTLPFPVGSRVQYRSHQGVIQPDKYDGRFLKQGKVCVLTDEQAEENRRGSFQNGGFVANWEDLVLIEEENK